MLELFWLGATAFVAGDKISIADLLMVTELDMLHMLAGSDEVNSKMAYMVYNIAQQDLLLGAIQKIILSSASIPALGLLPHLHTMSF